MQEINCFSKITDFVDFQAIDDNDNYDSNTDAESDANVSDIEFIDDENDFNESVLKHTRPLQM